MGEASDSRTIEQHLAALGYGHRAHENSDRCGRGRIVFRVSDGEVVGQMEAHEAAAFCRTIESASSSGGE
jgi:hypothetical protein